MNAEQFIEFANNFAKASAKTSTVQIQQAFEDNLDCLARPGDRVVVIRKPWHIGRWGTVIAFHELDPCYFRVEVDIEGKAHTHSSFSIGALGRGARLRKGRTSTHLPADEDQWLAVSTLMEPTKQDLKFSEPVFCVLKEPKRCSSR
jgi:hypothetical protein